MPQKLSSPIWSSSPIVDQVLNRKRRYHRSKSRFNWALINFVAAIVIVFEAQCFHLILGSKSSWRVFLSRLEMALASVFIVNAIFDVLSYIIPSSAPEVTLSSAQRKLLHITDDDPLFKSQVQKHPAHEQTDKKKPAHPFGFAEPLEGSFILSSFQGAPSPMTCSSRTYMASSPASALSLNTSSWQYFKGGNNSSLTTPPHQSASYKEPTNITCSSDGALSDEKSLNEYLSSIKSKAHNDASSLNSSSWSFNSPGAALPDYSPILKKLTFQLSSPIPTNNFTQGDSEHNSGSGILSKRFHSSSTEHICHKLGIDPQNLVHLMQNLRMWISQTILERVVAQIKSTNEKLINQGLSDTQIGVVGVEKLRKCAHLLPEPLASSIMSLIPFLDITIHQEYLVERLGQLASSGAMSDYRWNSGSDFKGSPWNDKLPSDCEIVMNCFAAYLDFCMPANHGTLDGKPFTNVYLIKAPEKMDKSVAPPSLATAISSAGLTATTTTTASTNATGVGTAEPSSQKCVIVQTSQRPPSYFLQVMDEKWDVNPGRNNLFHVILLFLHYIKTKEGGVLGRINFGITGINVLWIID